MLTLKELMTLLSESYSAEELVCVLELTSGQLVEDYEDLVRRRYKRLLKTVVEDGIISFDEEEE